MLTLLKIILNYSSHKENFYLFIYFNFILFLNFTNCISFAKSQGELLTWVSLHA